MIRIGTTNHLKHTVILASVFAQLPAHALNQPQHGMYLGFYTGPVYLQNIDSVRLPQIDNLTTGVSHPSMQSKFGWGIGIQLGYRILDHLRLEGQFITSFNKPRRLIFGGGQTKVPNAVWTINGFTDTAYGAIFNIYIDFLRRDVDGTFKTSAPYIGVGIGYAGLTNQLKVSENGGAFGTVYASQPTTLVEQIILGWNFYADDFTTVGIDYRRVHYNAIHNFTSGYVSHGLNVTLNFILGNPPARKT